MRILLDTHIFLWYINADSRLPTATLAILRARNNELFLSSISIWEMLQKHQIGKLPLPQAPERFLPLQRQHHGVESLPFEEASACRLTNLPPIHKDPFDRMLICQALTHDLVIATLDANIRIYPVRVL